MPAPQPVVTATAVPVGAPANAAPHAHVVDGDSDAPPNAGFAEKAVLEAKIVRQIAQERKATDLAWGIGFLVCILIEYGLGFYEINNAIKVTAEKWDKLDSMQASGQCMAWSEGETDDTHGYVVYTLDGPSEKQTPIIPGWDSFQSAGTCGTGDLATWVNDADSRTCKPPANKGWSLNPFGLASDFGSCPDPPAPPATQVGGGGMCDFENDGECDQPAPAGTGSCPAGTDLADCGGGSGRRMLRTTSRNRQPAPPPPANNYAVAANYSGSEYMTLEVRDLGHFDRFEMFTWLEAKQTCASQGARLCTAEEIVIGKGGGCTVPESMAWAADECDGGHVAATAHLGANVVDATAGAIDNKKMHCASDCDEMRRALVCCADTVSGKTQGPRDFAAEYAAAAAAEEVRIAKKTQHKTLQQKKEDEKQGSSYTGGGFLGGMVTALFTCILVAALAGVAYIYSLRENPRCMTWAANLFFPIMLFLVGLFVMYDLPTLGIILWIFAALAVCMIMCWRAQIEVTAKLLGMASQTLLDNGGLIPVKGILMVMELFITLPVVVFSVTSYFQSADWTQMYQEPGNPDCTEICGFAYGASPSRFFHHFMLIWVGMLFMEIMVHTIAGATAMWYFHRDDATYDMPSSPAFTALKWSLSSGFGSLAMAAFILTVVRIIIMMIQEAERKAREEGGAMVFVMCILRCIAETLEAWIQFITKMSTIVVAITNDEFWPSCKRTMGMFYRCYMEGIMIERFANITLNFFSLAVSLIMFVLSYFILGAVLPDDMLQSVFMPILPAIIICIISYLTLQLLAGGVLVIINSLYISYLVDLDNEYAPNETTQEIHAVYEEAVNMSVGLMDTNGNNYKKSGAYRRQFDQQGGRA